MREKLLKAAKQLGTPQECLSLTAQAGIFSAMLLCSACGGPGSKAIPSLVLARFTVANRKMPVGNMGSGGSLNYGLSNILVHWRISALEVYKKGKYF